MACHQVCQVPKGLCSVAVGSDVDVHSAHVARVALGFVVPELSDQFLQAFDVLVGEDRGEVWYPLRCAVYSYLPVPKKVAAVFAAFSRLMPYISTSTPMVWFFMASICALVLSFMVCAPFECCVSCLSVVY